MAPSLHMILPSSSSPMGRVQKATSRVLLGPNLLMNIDICVCINTNPWQAKAYVKAVKKRLQNKNSKVQLLALKLLETMMEKCGDVLHFQVVDYAILQEMVKIIRKTRNMQVRDIILALLESWQEAFGGAEGRYPQYYYTYAELKRSGIRFPLSQKGDDINTTITNQSQVGRGMPSNSIEKLDEIMEPETNHHSISNLDLDNVQSVAELLNNMLQVVNPKDRQAIKDEVITDLANQCSINQKKLMKLINSTENDVLLGKALTLNDNIQIVISKYNAQISGSSSPLEKAPEVISELALARTEQFDGNEDEEDGFSSIAKRKSVLKKEEDEENSSNKKDLNTEITALILFDPPSPAGISPKNEEDMIDLLSLTLSENQSSQTDLVSNNNQNPFFDSPLISNSYIAPWAQPLSPQFPEKSPVFSHQSTQYHTDYLPKPWIDSGASLNPFQYTISAQTLYTEESQFSILKSSNGHQNKGESFKSSKAYMPDNLFGDLIELRNSDGSLKSKNASKLWVYSGQDMTSVG